MKRVLFTEDISDTPPIDQYDLIVVDECHRGYLLDRELFDAELTLRNQDDYISKYRRVLEHFDAVKIGLTATPALHTVSIFGDPVFKYSYREAVVDGYLIDHQPPIQITTALSQAGIKFKKGEQVELIDTKTGTIDLTHAPDEIKFDVDEFNRRLSRSHSIGWLPKNSLATSIQIFPVRLSSLPSAMLMRTSWLTSQTIFSDDERRSVARSS